jgi:hypothetical protein
MFFVAAAAYREENSMNPMALEQRGATTSKLTHIAAGKAPNFFGFTHAGEERKRTAHEQQNKRERFHAGRFNDHSVIMRLSCRKPFTLIVRLGLWPDGASPPLSTLLDPVQLLVEPHRHEHHQEYRRPDAEHAHRDG